MENYKKQWLFRSVTGGCAGVALHVLLGYLLGSFSLFGPSRFTGFRFPDCNFPYELEPLGVLLSFALWALFGAEVGIATLPFAGSGRELAVRSLVHFAATSATALAWGELNINEMFWGVFLWIMIPLTLVYVLIWLGRWVGWYAEVAAIREKLGLAPGPSLFHWKETLPYVGFACLLCLLLPLVLRRLDPIDVPLLSSVLYAWLLLPAGGFTSGLSLGKRHGLCLIYPLSCAVFILLFLCAARLMSNMADGYMVPMAAVPPLAGNALGAVLRRRKAEKGSGALRDGETPGTPG